MSQAELWTRTALVVADDDVLARVLQFVLQGEGYTVRRVADGRQARALIEHGIPPDLVMLDFRLPDATAVELLETMRATAEWRRVPVLVLSAEPRQSMDLTAPSDVGPVAIMEKPIRTEELRACISRLLNGSALHGVHRRAAAGLVRHGRRC